MRLVRLLLLQVQSCKKRLIIKLWQSGFDLTAFFVTFASMEKDAVLNISVVMCTYNGAAYLKEQLDSILSQSYPIHEIVIQDDGSTDGTMELLASYAERQSKIKVFQNEGPHGINPNFFSAMRRATGDYLALSDQDDIWEPRKLEKQVAAMGDCWLSSGLSIPFSSDGYPIWSDRRKPNYHILRIAYLGVLPGHTLLISKKLLDYLLDGSECLYLYDWQLQLIATAAERVSFVDETLVHFRRHVSAATATAPVSNKKISTSALRYIGITLFHHRSLQRHLRIRFKVIQQMLESCPFETTSKALCLEMARLQIAHGPIAFLRRMVFFVRHQEYLFYTIEKRSLVTFLRALYYPFSCGYYYRGILKKKS